MRSQQEKWRVPDEDPAGQSPEVTDGVRQRKSIPGEFSSSDGEAGARSGLIYCGLCSALNPSSSHYCAACGATLVDAFHASEGLRVYAQPDTAARIIDIVAPGSELDIVEDPDSPADFVRVTISYGRLGYIRVADIESLGATGLSSLPPIGSADVNIAARGCITQTSALGALLLVVVMATLTLLFVQQSDSAESGIIALAACSVIGPLLLVTIGLYVYARGRDERLASRAEDAEERGA